MTVLSDKSIHYRLEEGELNIEPIDFDKQIQPCSLDVRLGNEVYYPKEDKRRLLENWEQLNISNEDFILVNTREYFKFPNDLAAMMTGRSTFGREGLTVHQTAGWFDAGFQGEGVMELCNVSNSPVLLSPGERIAQMVFFKLDTPAENPYNEEDNNYQNQEGAVAARL